jgi:hypothetical protein
MIDFIPYFAGLITLLFGIASAYALLKAGPKKNGK